MQEKKHLLYSTLALTQYTSVGSIAEAQEWEYKLIEVQDWLAEKDLLLSAHLEQELTVDDLPDETQVLQTRKH